MSIYDVAINKSKVKFRWGEKYASEGANLQTGVNDPGVYVGANVSVYGAAPSQRLTIQNGGAYSVIVHRDPATYYGVVVKETDAIILDLTYAESGTVWPIGTGGLDLYVFMSVDYSENAETTAYWGIDEYGNLPTGAVVLAKVELPEGATEILNDYIKTDGTNRAKPLKSKKIIIPKVVSFTTNANGRFAIYDYVSRLGSGLAIGSKGHSRLIQLRSAGAYIANPLIDSDGNALYANYWYTTGSSSTLIDDTDVDLDGCYYGPWIQVVGPGGVVGTGITGNAIYHTAISLESIVTSGVQADLGFGIGHTDLVYGGDIDDTPDSITQGYLSSQLTDILGLVNGRIKTINTDAATTSWTLLWRSNDISSDATVDANTLSIYYKTNGILLARGGYVSGDDFVITSLVVDPNSELYAHSIEGEATYFRFARRAGAATLSLTTYSDWTSYDRKLSNSHTFYKLYQGFNFSEYANIQMVAAANAGGYDRYVEIMRIAEGRLRAYYGSATNYYCLIIANGCYWNNSTQRWIGQADSKNAECMYIGRDGVSIKNKSYNDADFGTGWTDVDTSWKYVWRFLGSDSGQGHNVVYGESNEEFVVPFHIALNSNHVKAMAGDSSYNGPTLNEAINFRINRNTIPSYSDFSYEKNGIADATLTNLVAEDITHWGARISADIDLTEHMDSFNVETLTNPNSIRITNASTYTWRPGQVVAIRDTGYTLVWTIEDATVDGTDVVLIVDDSVEEVASDSSPTSTLYTVFADQENKEIVAFYRAKLYA